MLTAQPHSSPEAKPLLPTRAPPAHNATTTTLVGFAFMLAGAVCWALLTFFVRVGAVRYNFPTNCSILLRALVVLAASLGILLAFERAPRQQIPRRDQLPLLGVRGLAGTLGCVTIFQALRRIPVGEATTLFSTSPIFTALMCSVFLGEPVTLVAAGAMLASLAGVVLIARPPVLFHDPDAGPAARSGEHLAGVLLACGAALCASTVSTLLRRMGTRVHYLVNVMALGVGLLVLSLASLSREDVWHLRHNQPGVLVNLGAALGGFGCIACFTRGLQCCRGGPAMVVRTTDVPIAFALGWLFLGEKVAPTTVAGAVLVVGAALAVAVEDVVGKGDRSIAERSRQVEQTSQE